MKKPILITALLLSTVLLWSQDLRISQIDSNALMFKGEIDIYFSLPGADSSSLKAEDFSVIEKKAGVMKITSFETRPNEKAAIDFILLVDNSGSMYEESFQGEQRMEQARTALEAFLDEIEESGDNAAVYTFNTDLKEAAELGTDIPGIRRSLSTISQPDTAGSYTELYNSLISTASAFPGKAGRRAVIVLSDGENYSVSEHSGSSHPFWKNKVAEPDEIITAYHENGVTLDGISISDNRDAALGMICAESGGRFYDVRSTEEISGVYSAIREKILNEYKITVEAPPLDGSIGEITLAWQTHSDSRMLMVPLLFGGSSESSMPVLLILLAAAAAGIAALFIIPFDRPSKNPQIQGLDSNQKTILSEGSTIIGASRDADFTLAGGSGADPEHATIVKDDKTGAYTIVSKRPVRVNNRKVKTKTLSPGDVIRIEGSTIIFDEPDSTIVQQ
ncbi:MAG: VWA domain-containing protein [Spirochaetales bacterium]|uniref:VWA domain-containing protein n=1 Tax=Candidatus Thalassospirochaeta sargassi TaxID=3119039 RepID=A0AAJ1IDD4_9SPIO|nr:VWA domain-containing protein [Spirochaetales bacterium]